MKRLDDERVAKFSFDRVQLLGPFHLPEPRRVDVGGLRKLEGLALVNHGQLHVRRRVVQYVVLGQRRAMASDEGHRLVVAREDHAAMKRLASRPEQETRPEVCFRLSAKRERLRAVPGVESMATLGDREVDLDASSTQTARDGKSVGGTAQDDDRGPCSGPAQVADAEIIAGLGAVEGGQLSARGKSQAFLLARTTKNAIWQSVLHVGMWMLAAIGVWFLTRPMKAASLRFRLRFNHRPSPGLEETAASLGRLHQLVRAAKYLTVQQLRVQTGSKLQSHRVGVDRDLDRVPPGVSERPQRNADSFVAQLLPPFGCPLGSKQDALPRSGTAHCLGKSFETAQTFGGRRGNVMGKATFCLFFPGAGRV